MPKRCGDPECGNLVNERKAHARLGDKIFCGESCAQAWLKQNDVFKNAADPFHTPIPPTSVKRMNGG